MSSVNSSLNLFINQLLMEKGMTNLDPEVMQQLRQDLLEQLEMSINARILKELPEEKLPEFESLLDEENNDAEIQTFLSNNIPNYTSVIAEEFSNFRAAYI